MTDGRENGFLRRYYNNGELKAAMTCTNGEVDSTSVQLHQPTEGKVVKRTEAVDSRKPKTVRGDRPNPVVNFVADGHNILYNKHKQMSQDGHFKDGRLYDGTWYRYDENGILLRIERYKEGRYVGNVPSEGEPGLESR